MRRREISAKPLVFDVEIEAEFIGADLIETRLPHRIPPRLEAIEQRRDAHALAGIRDASEIRLEAIKGRIERLERGELCRRGLDRSCFRRRGRAPHNRGEPDCDNHVSPASALHRGAALKAIRKPTQLLCVMPHVLQRFVDMMPWPPGSRAPPPRISRCGRMMLGSLADGGPS